MEVVQELLPGVFVLKGKRFEDQRGALSVPFDAEKFRKCTGQPLFVSQTMHSTSGRGVLRGLHFQSNTAPVAKLVSCLKGTIYDVIVDLREKSLSYGSWVSVELSELNRLQVYAPAGTAHGYLSLTDSEVFYYQEGDFSPESSCILAWDDPTLKIKWPISLKTGNGVILSDRDRYGGISWETYKSAPMF
jgi:dTDP-4-dehydrorhamnose 3,5-epimerase